ncbi:MAG: PH domain-containing protein [Chloroflexi bacterium]|nr:PH domain-containing protein [Chloroflexota bacterium]MCY4247881.1 PH domain-containing protein [Chloroflexota bacterium]
MFDSASQKQINPRFAEQRAGETMLVDTRRHSWAFWRSAWLPALLLPIMWLAAAQAYAQALQLGLLGLSLLLPGAALVYFYLEWRNDSVIITDQRIIRIHRTIVTMQRQISQVGMESVHEVNFELPSGDIFARLLRYGTVIVKTAGAQGNLELDLMPHPERIQQLVLATRKGYGEKQAQRHGQMVRAEMQRWMAGEATDGDWRAQEPADQPPPRPVRGSNGYLSARIEMSNGDIVYRKHISVWLRHTAIPLAVTLVALAALILTFTVVAPEMRVATFSIAMTALLVGSLGYYWLDWDWRNDMYILSDDTITLVHKRPFFLQNLRDQILVERIDNVESSTSGFVSALLKVGDVRMSLVGADEAKLFTRVHKPAQIQQEISRRQHNKARRRARYDAMQQRQILGDYLTIANSAAHPANPATATQRDLQSSAVINSDRNRPPRLPRKLAPRPAAPRSDSSLASPNKPRPPRFRAR